MTNTLNLSLKVVGVMALALVGFSTAYAADVTFSETTTVTIGSANYQIDSSSAATTVDVGATTATIVVPASSTVVFGSLNRYTLTNDLGLTTTCTTGSSYLTITGAATVVITPNTTEGCASSGGGGGGGGSSSNDDDDDEPVSTPTSAPTTLAGLQALLNSLLAQLAALKGESSPAAVPGSFGIDLDLGANGADVSKLQAWLIAKGYAIPAGATGYFGAQTQSAIAAYQKAKGITPAVGFFGPKTRASVNAGS